MKDFYRVSEVAKMFNITANKIRFYEEKGLIKPLRDKDSSYRKFNRTNLIELQAILLYRTIGLSIDDIRDILNDRSSENFIEHFTKQWTIVNDEIHQLSDIRVSIGKILDGIYEDDKKEVNDEVLRIIENTKLLNELRNSWSDKWNFDSWAETYDEDVKKDITELKMYKNYQYVLNKVFELGKTDGEVLDIGAGTGNLSGKFLERNYNVVSIDQSREMIKKAKEKYPELKVRIGEFLKIPFESNSFDSIVSTYAFHHLNNNEKSLAIKEMMRVLRKDGKIVIGDLMFKNDEERKNVLASLNSKQVQEVEGEYFSNVEFLESEVGKLAGKIIYEKVDDITYIIVISF